MICQEILACLECAIPHECFKESSQSSRCAQCDIGYSFIANEPILLECGHHVCKACKPKIENGSLNCRFCTKRAKTTNVKEAASDLFEALEGELVKELSNKFEATINLYYG